MGENPGVMVDEAELSDPDLAEPVASRRPLVAGAAAGLWALLVGVALVTCVVMLAWAVSPDAVGDSAAAWRAAGMTWLGAHLVPLEIGGRTLSLLPLGGPVLGLLLARRGGRWAGRLLTDPTPGEAAGIVVAAAAVYGAGGIGIAWLSSAGGSGASPVDALFWTAAVALAGVTWGIAGAAGLVEGIRSRLSQAAWHTLLGGLAAVIGLLAVGSALVTLSLIRHAGQAASTLADLGAGVLGEAVLTLLGVLCLPTLAVWGLSVAVGPGFQITADSGLSAFGGQVDTLPALPVLAAVPASMPSWTPVLLVLPVALGGLAGRIRWGRDLPTLAGSLRSAVGLAGVVGALVAALAAVASGSLGGGRLESVGPQALPVAAAAAGLVVLGFLADAGLQLAVLSWQLHRAEQAAAHAQRAHRTPLVDTVEGGDPAGVPDSSWRESSEGAAHDAATPAGTVRPQRRARSIPLSIPGHTGSKAPTTLSSQEYAAPITSSADLPQGAEEPDEPEQPEQPENSEYAEPDESRESDDATRHAVTAGAGPAGRHEEPGEPIDEVDPEVDLGPDPDVGAEPHPRAVAGSAPDPDDDHTMDIVVPAPDLEELRAAARGARDREPEAGPCGPR